MVNVLSYIVLFKISITALSPQSKCFIDIRRQTGKLTFPDVYVMIFLLLIRRAQARHTFC